MFSAYHALKADMRCFLVSSDTHGPMASSNLDFYRNWICFAQHFNAEAVECGLSSTLFSVASFKSFLARLSMHPTSASAHAGLLGISHHSI